MDVIRVFYPLDLIKTFPRVRHAEHGNHWPSDSPRSKAMDREVWDRRVARGEVE